jgi:hypothetical protein
MGAPQLIPARPSDDAERLARLLLAEPAVGGRLRDARFGALAPNYSGALMLEGAWDGGAAIAKVGATPREVHWMRELARVDPGLIPTLHASGDALGDEPLAWMVMERCAHEVGWQWGGVGYGMLLEAGVRFQLAARAIAGAVGAEDVDVEGFCALAGEALACDPPPPGPAERVVARMAEEWAWVLRTCRVETCHGDLHPGNAVSRAAPPDPGARALLIDHAPAPMPWATEPARCEILYWRTQTPRGEPTLVHAMAAIRAREGLEVPAPGDLDRLAALFIAWHALRLWPNASHRQLPSRAEYPEAVRGYMEAAAT